MKNQVKLVRNLLWIMAFLNVWKRAASTISKGAVENSLVVNADATNRTLIWMHGLGDTPHGFADIFQQLAPKTMRVVLLQAPTQPVTINGGMKMPSWYDIKDFTRNNEDEHGIRESAKQINQCVEMEINRMMEKNAVKDGSSSNKEECDNTKIESVSSNVFIGGFSQGGAMAVYCGYHYPQKLGGVVALSAYVLGTCGYPGEIHAANKETALFACHGDMDQVVPYQYSELSFNQIKEHITMKYEKLSGLQHEVHPKEIENVCNFVMNGGDLSQLSKAKL